MASVDYKKLHTASEVKAMLRHCDTEMRLHTKTHANSDIMKELTETNVKLTDLSYADACAFYDKKIKQIDSSGNRNRRKDRVTCFGLCWTCPAGFDREKALKFFEKSREVVKQHYKNAVEVASYIHFDEKKEYVRHGEFYTSRAHIHMYIIPRDEKSQLCGKSFSSKKNMKTLNEEIDEMCRAEFNCNFMTHEKQKTGRSVEELKADNSENEKLYMLTKVLREESEKELEKLLKDRNIRKKLLKALQKSENLALSR